MIILIDTDSCNESEQGKHNSLSKSLSGRHQEAVFYLFSNLSAHAISALHALLWNICPCNKLIPYCFSIPTLPDMEPLSLSEVRQQNEVWLEPISPDPDLRNELRGWYQVKDRFVQNEYGARFYLGTYAAKWLAFEKGE